MYLNSKKSSTIIKIPNNSVLPVMLSHKKYSIPSISKKNNNPKAKNSKTPFSRTCE